MKRLFVSLRKISEIMGGYAFKSSLMSTEPKEYQIVKMSNLYQGTFDLSRNPSFWEEVDSKTERYLLKPDDILMTLTGTVGKRDYGYTVQLRDDKNLLLNQRVCRIRPIREKASSFYLFQYLRTQEFLNKFFNSSIGGTGNQSNVGISCLRELDIYLPPLPEQKAIADLLSTWDEAIDKTERLIQAKEKRFKWLLRKLIQEPRKGREWKKVKLGEVGEIKKGKGITKADLVNEGVPCIRYAEVYTKYNFSTVNIDSYVSVKTFKTALELNFGDVIFAASGETQKDIGKCVAYLSTEIACTGGDTLVFRPNLKTCNALFLGFAFNTAKINKQKSALCHGNSVVHLYGKDLFKIEFHLPTLEEQQQIADTLSTAQQEINILKQIAEKYKTQKRGLMQKVLTGQWRIKPEVVKRYA